MLRRRARILTSISVLGMAIAAIVHAEPPSDNGDRTVDEVRSSFRSDAVPVLTEALAAVVASGAYRESVGLDDAVGGMLRGLVAALDDPYAGLAVRPAVQDDPHGTGEEAGASAERGIVLDIDRFGRLTVGAVLAGSPADRAGLRSGDTMLRVDGRNLAGSSP